MLKYPSTPRSPGRDALRSGVLMARRRMCLSWTCLAHSKSSRTWTWTSWPRKFLQAIELRCSCAQAYYAGAVHK
ncbi:g2524 [Coccomyxa viridis]|uniref:G2524 protein n=1 Tax=Coccomyxa viridis TaxID=1274662 RepID=A0ABP1FKK5_9CHLO